MNVLIIQGFFLTMLLLQAFQNNYQFLIKMLFGENLISKELFVIVFYNYV